MNTSIKYPKTFHLPFSESLQNDDRRMEDETCFDDKTVAVTIKMDGENTSMYRNGIHARSLDSSNHPSRSVIKAIHAQIKYDIPEGWRICGENMYARHSIHYTDLESFFYVFNVWNEKNEALSLQDTRQFCKELNLTHVKVDTILQDCNFEGDKDHFRTMEMIYRTLVAQGQEGIVVRNVESFHYNDFQQNLAKAVRKNHVQTDEHWKTTWIPNKLKEEK